jgi:hypothetical protein
LVVLARAFSLLTDKTAQLGPRGVGSCGPSGVRGLVRRRSVYNATIRPLVEKDS